LPIQVPTVELIEIGAGGGSIATIDDLGLVRVGPRSAGSQPGPACYGQGGTEPTVTDADLVLGYLDHARFLGGDLTLEPDRALTALSALGLEDGDPRATAVAIRRVVDEQMAAAARMHAVEQGLDPRRFALVATGGAGPVHACSVARILGIDKVLSPARAGVASAHGFLGAPAGFDLARSAPSLLRDLRPDVVAELLAELESEARERIGSAGGHRVVEADLRYRGQGDAVTVRLAPGFEEAPARALEEALSQEYNRRYGRVPDGVVPELLTWRLSYLEEPPVNLPMPAERDTRSGSREVWFAEANGYVTTPVLTRNDAAGPGPRIVEERETTLVVPPDAEVRILEDDVLEVSL
jgi:N-methylhydantoinase A